VDSAFLQILDYPVIAGAGETLFLPKRLRQNLLQGKSGRQDTLLLYHQ
jgi:hypothetical protein